MFPEYRDLMSRLKGSHPRYNALFEKHNSLDHEIARLEGSNGAGYNQEVAKLKKEKLALKDEIYKILQEEAGKH
ncbi:YdcH family protein [Pseudomonas sp. F1_0610]|uniref:YdcH family protein n=1 Tax=Pseudomonas sp. F1_0610 TaxID=3114284 RepID=UPI0039C33C65